jgi:dephospho-CoA kinase
MLNPKEVIAFKTDTVWGFGCNPDDKIAVEKIYEIKKRDSKKPLILMSDNFKHLKKYTLESILAPLFKLFEAGLEQECEAVFCVLADRDVRLARIMARDGITKEAALHRIEAQHTDDFFLSRCHFILENNGDLQALSVRVNAIFEALQL